MATPLFSQTIAEKKEGAVSTEDLTQEMQKFLLHVNEQLRSSQADLHKLYAQVSELFEQNAPPEAYQELLYKINFLRETIIDIETHWREIATQGGQIDSYALWH
jgi:hypothetical protein